MVTADIVQSVQNKLDEIYSIAQRKWNVVKCIPTIEYKRIGTTAGRAFFGKNKIILNPDYFNQNAGEMVNVTLPHEAAHLIAYSIDNERGRGHGRLWKIVMMGLGLRPDRCHQFDTTQARMRITQKFSYICLKCGQTVLVGKNVHGKIISGYKKYFHSRPCLGEIKYQP